MYEREHEFEVIEDPELHDVAHEEPDEELDGEVDRLGATESGEYEFEDVWADDEEDWG